VSRAGAAAVTGDFPVLDDYDQLPMSKQILGIILVTIVLVGCGTNTAAPPSASTSVTAAAATPSSTVSQTKFVSTIYHYTITVPSGWNTYPATVAWTGKQAVSHAGPEVDLFSGSTLAWGYALRTPKTLASFTPLFNQQVAAAHPCPVKPETQRAFTIDGAPALVESLHCAPVTGILVLSALVAKGGVIYVFQLQDPARVASDDADRAAFTQLLTSVRLP